MIRLISNNIYKLEDIQVLTLDGEPVNLKNDYANKSVFVLFFNRRCLGCVGRAIPLAYEYLKEYEGLEVIGIHTSFGNEVVTKDDIINIFTTKELPFPIFYDIDRTNYEKFECEGTPHWLIFDKWGNLFRSFYGSQDGAQTRLMYAIDELVANSN